MSSFSFQHLGRHTPPYHGKFFLFLSSFSFQHLSWADTHFLTIESFLFLSISSSSFKHYSWAETHHITDLFPLSSLCQWMAKKTFPYPPFFQKFMTTSTEFATKFFRSEMTPPPLIRSFSGNSKVQFLMQKNCTEIFFSKNSSIMERTGFPYKKGPSACNGTA